MICDHTCPRVLLKGIQETAPHSQRINIYVFLCFAADKVGKSGQEQRLPVASQSVKIAEPTDPPTHFRRFNFILS